MTPTPSDPEILEHIEELASRGIKLNKTQIWILIRTYEKPHTIKELASLRNVTPQAMRNSVKQLELLGLIDDAFPIGREHYWRCRVDISDSVDFTLKVRLRKQDLTFEQLLGYLQSEYDVASYKKGIRAGLAYLYDRSVRRSRGEKLTGPTGTEIKSMFLKILADFNEVQMFLNRIVELPIYEVTDTLQDQFGYTFQHEITPEFISWCASVLRNHWGTTFNVKGLNIGSTPRDDAEEQLKNWQVPE